VCVTGFSGTASEKNQMTNSGITEGMISSSTPNKTPIIRMNGRAGLKRQELIKGKPGEDQQKTFYENTRTWGDTQRIPVFFFEAFYDNWKGGSHPDEVEKHLGLFRVDRSAKAAVVPVLQTP